MQKRNHPVFLSPRRVSSFDRIAARVFDLVVALALFSLGNALSYPLGVCLCFAYLLLQDGWGQSIGKRLFGLRVLQDGTERPTTLAQSALRNVPFAIGVLFVAIPAFWVFFILVFLPLLMVETHFVLRLDSGARLGDVLAETYVDDGLRRPQPMLAHSGGSESNEEL